MERKLYRGVVNDGVGFETVVERELRVGVEDEGDVLSTIAVSAFWSGTNTFVETVVSFSSQDLFSNYSDTRGKP